MYELAKESAREVKTKLGLPLDGRNSLSRFSTLESVFRSCLHPDIPSFDVNRVQPADFDEFSYTDGPNLFYGHTQSIEINTRLLLEASYYDETITDYINLFTSLKDKWDLGKQDKSALNKKVFFPPGVNMRWLINTDYVLRKFAEDKSWMLKPHPVTTDEDVKQAKIAFGITRLFDRKKSGMSLFYTADEIGYTTTSEFGLLALMNNKKMTNFSKFDYEPHGSYYSFYKTIRIRENELPGKEVINRILSCPWSGVVDINISLDEAEKRFKLFKEKAIELREKYKPLVRFIAKVPNNE